jgi:carbamoyltransferase
MRILGLSCWFHDAAAALLEDGRLVAAAEEERFSRVKHDAAFPERAIRFCLDEARVGGRDLDYVAFFEKPFLKFERILQTALATVPASQQAFRQAMTAWMLDKLWIKNRIRDALGIAPDRILFVEHHQSHAASAFFCSPFEDAAVLTVDGVGEWATTTMGAGTGNRLSLDFELRFPHSLGLLYSTFTAFLGFEVNEGEYKVMGLAPYGTPRYEDEVWRLIHQSPDGAFALDLDYFDFHHAPDRMYSRRFESLFGPARRPDEPVDRFADLAASVQRVTEAIMMRLASAACERAGTTRLCLAGGVALNSVANGRLLRETPVTELFVQPAAGDSGAALGAALYVWHQVLGQPRKFVLEHAAWGAAIEPGAARAAARARGLSVEECDDRELVARVAELLAAGRVVGWAQGRFEWGPRALGQRSILADPRRASMRDVVNARIKFREAFRPFAPAVPAARAAAFFELDGPPERHPSRFMSVVVPVRDAARDRLAAVTHVDGSARVQTVLPGPNPRYHAVIEAFGAATGTPAVLNTSFNLQGEPIVNTAAEAIDTFQRCDMDALVLDRFILAGK